MRKSKWLVLPGLLVLSALILWCQPKTVPATAFDLLARRVPADTDSVIFYNLKPVGDAGRYWERIRARLDVNEAARAALGSAFGEFGVSSYGLDEFTTGPAVQWSAGQSTHTIFQLGDEVGAREAMLQRFKSSMSREVEFEGRTLYQGWDPGRAGRGAMAWTVADGLLFLSFSTGGQVLTGLQEVLSLAPEHSLAELSSWRRLRDWLPQEPMGLVFVNAARAASTQPAPSGDAALNELLGRQLLALGLAFVPEEAGMRVEIAGVAVGQEDAPPEIRDLFSLPAVNPAAWAGLPAETGLALIAHDAPVVWPVFQALFGVGSSDAIRTGLGLDLEADLMGEEGPLTGAFCLAVTPPLPGQPIIEGLPALQVLFAAQGTSQEQVDGVRAAMEGRGASFGPAAASGLDLQVQAGTGVSGYAISYGFDGDTLLLGTSPEIIGRWADARRANDGLPSSEAFQAVTRALPPDPSIFLYMDAAAMKSVLQANMTAEQYEQQNQQVGVLLEVFDAIGLGLRMSPDMIDGALYFYMP
jgi:hypothetical protein